MKLLPMGELFISGEYLNIEKYFCPIGEGENSL
jgi:hypothetical protein